MAITNPLMPQDASANPSPGLGQGSDPIASLESQNNMASARLKKLDSHAAIITKTRSELDSLVQLGDLVEDEDVIRAVGKVVAAGGSPMPLASMLADAPFGNREALQAWIAQKDASIRQVEAQMSAAHQQARHQIGQTGLRLLAGHAIAGATQQPPAQAPSPLAPGEAPGRAYGGNVLGGQPYTVGEQGPETFVPDQAGTIVPNPLTQLAANTPQAAGPASVTSLLAAQQDALRALAQAQQHTNDQNALAPLRQRADDAGRAWAAAAEAQMRAQKAKQ